ncbi:hypothetical protein OH77DRAFT_495582 [Trametes cingulata]|nr:hypothetical protein OH77DRAFT_495582 [Trametes cingulata]
MSATAALFASETCSSTSTARYSMSASLPTSLGPARHILRLREHDRSLGPWVLVRRRVRLTSRTRWRGDANVALTRCLRCPQLALHIAQPASSTLPS